jgi:uncharacterized protein YjbI with pentapeptide repeats
MAEDNENKEDLTEILASEILDKIQKGEPVEYDHIRMANDLELPAEYKIVSSSIKITNSKFDANINFSNCLFRDLTQFENTTFNKDAKFKNATFEGKANFKDSLFEDVRFTEATFRENAIFQGAKFKYGYFDKK